MATKKSKEEKALQRGANYERNAFVSKFHRMLRAVDRPVVEPLTDAAIATPITAREVLVSLIEFAKGREARTEATEGGL